MFKLIVEGPEYFSTVTAPQSNNPHRDTSSRTQEIKCCETYFRIKSSNLFCKYLICLDLPLLIGSRSFHSGLFIGSFFFRVFIGFRTQNISKCQNPSTDLVPAYRRYTKYHATTIINLNISLAWLAPLIIITNTLMPVQQIILHT